MIYPHIFISLYITQFSFWFIIYLNISSTQFSIYLKFTNKPNYKLQDLTSKLLTIFKIIMIFILLFLLLKNLFNNKKILSFNDSLISFQKKIFIEKMVFYYRYIMTLKMILKINNCVNLRILCKMIKKFPMNNSFY